MNLIQGKRFGNDVYMNIEKIVCLGPDPNHPDRTWIRCEDGEEYNFDLPIVEILKQIPIDWPRRSQWKREPLLI